MLFSLRNVQHNNQFRTPNPPPSFILSLWSSFGFLDSPGWLFLLNNVARLSLSVWCCSGLLWHHGGTAYTFLGETLQLVAKELVSGRRRSGRDRVKGKDKGSELLLNHYSLLSLTHVHKVQRKGS